MGELSLRIRSPTYPSDKERDTDKAANCKGRKGGGPAVLNTANKVRKAHKCATGVHVTSVTGNLDEGNFNEVLCKDTETAPCFLIIL